MNGNRFTISVIISVCLFSSFFYQWFNNRETIYTQIVDSDGKGYYAYLPAIFIYHDISFIFFSKPENKKISRYFNDRFIIPQNGKSVLKTYCGESVVLLPFFLTGCAVQNFIGGCVNGYEPIMQFFICLGALFYLALGLYYLRKFLRFYHLSDTDITLTSFLIVLGTNLFYYAVFHPTMTHVYSFSTISAFVFYVKKYFETNTKQSLFFAVIALALTGLLRPVNLLVLVIIPFLMPSFKTIIEGLNSLVHNYMLAFKLILLFFSITSIQLLLNYLQCHKLFVWSYLNEGFNFLNPHLLDVLFSFRKGLFVYSPLTFVACAGLFPLFKQQRKLFLGISILLLLCTYIIASWWNWSYGPGLGLRAFVDWYILFAILLAFLLNAAQKLLKKVLLTICFAFVALNIFQTWQYLWGIIHPEEMSREKYAYVFLKSSPNYYNCLGGGNEDHYMPLEEKPFIHTEIKTPVIFSAGVDSYSLLEFTDTSGAMSKPSFFVASLSRLEKEINACQKALVIITYIDAYGSSYFSNSLRINDLPRGKIYQWNTFTYTLSLPAIKSKTDTIKVYIWNIDKRSFLLDDFSLKFFHYQTKNP